MRRSQTETGRRGVALVAVMGILSVLLLVMFAVVGGLAGSGNQTLAIQSRLVAVSEERAAIARVWNTWRTDGRFDSRVSQVSPLIDDVATTRVGLSSGASSSRRPIQVSIRVATGLEDEYRAYGLKRRPRDVWVESVTHASAGGVFRKALYLCRDGDWNRSALVRAELIAESPDAATP